MKCLEGDSIHSKSISNYESLLSRIDFHNFNGYGLDIDETKELYKVLSDKFYKIYGIQTSAIKTDFSDGMLSENRLSICVKRKAYYDYVNPKTQIVRISTMIQDLLFARYGNIKYLASIHKEIRSSITKLSKSYLKPYYSGFYISDLDMTCYDDIQEILEYLNSNIKLMNNRLQSCSIESISMNIVGVKPSDTQLMIGTANKEVFKDLIERYQEWYYKDKNTLDILEQDIRASIHLMLSDKKVDKNSIKIKIAQKNKEWVLGFYSNIGVSPYLIIKKLYPKIKINEIYHNSQFTITNLYKNLDKLEHKTSNFDSNVCYCGNRLVYDMLNKKVSKVCSECHMRLLMSNYISR